MAHARLDFRSDTLTQPTAEMKAAMMAAPLGDDVFSEDPSVNLLQQRVAELFGKEAALFVTSGTMSNQLAVRVHCRPGDELLCEANCHIQNYEQGAHAQLSGVTASLIPGEYGVLEPEQFIGKIREENEHFVRTRLVCLENTHNRGAGRIQPYENVEAICGWARDNGLKTHLDGARLMNAVVATGIPPAKWAQHFDTVSLCFSKGLGAPVGSVLIGDAATIRAARRHRKALGGGMRQAGILAAAALYALDHHVERLAIDHENARQLAAAVREIDGLTLSPPDAQTNIIIFEVDPALGAAQEFAGRLAAAGLYTLATAPTRIRMVTHLDVDAEDVVQAAEILTQVAQQAARGEKTAAGLGQSYA